MQKKGRSAWGKVDRVEMIDVPEGDDEMVGAEVDGLKIRLPRNGGRPYVDTENGQVPLDGLFVSRPEVDALPQGLQGHVRRRQVDPEQHDAVQAAWGKVDRLYGGQAVSGEDRSVSVPTSPTVTARRLCSACRTGAGRLPSTTAGTGPR